MLCEWKVVRPLAKFFFFYIYSDSKKKGLYNAYQDSSQGVLRNTQCIKKFKAKNTGSIPALGSTCGCYVLGSGILNSKILIQCGQSVQIDDNDQQSMLEHYH